MGNLLFSEKISLLVFRGIWHQVFLKFMFVDLYLEFCTLGMIIKTMTCMMKMMMMVGKMMVVLAVTLVVIGSVWDGEGGLTDTICHKPNIPSPLSLGIIMIFMMRMITQESERAVRNFWD